ncbi:hypothetical protein D5086_017426 [Populus alba]|uniref:Uncharacterized protein n=1 Tax=Populus alba TaxID=43335 RepID=A0ACC4BWQ9_POPAL
MKQQSHDISVIQSNQRLPLVAIGPPFPQGTKWEPAKLRTHFLMNKCIRREACKTMQKSQEMKERDACNPMQRRRQKQQLQPKQRAGKTNSRQKSMRHRGNITKEARSKPPPPPTSQQGRPLQE